MKPKFVHTISFAKRCAKRLFDVVFALVALVLFSPLILIIWVAVLCQKDGPAIFSQERIGYKGKPFMLYKFRSMTVYAEEDGKPQLFSLNDSRLTKLGAFLRSHHLDEFPQLWNVLIGDMSFVGPRPERKFFIDQIMKFNPNYVLLYQLRPGLFSRATLYNGYTDTMEKMLTRLDMDLEYLQVMSLWEDVKIITLTALSIITGKKF